jgi:hypothetical protein
MYFDLEKIVAARVGDLGYNTRGRIKCLRIKL